ncbi:hypothetical protein Q9233_009538 [Columba guinea]|nr:hypothetical protein Q9233_009538 [Columba guinea]
MEARNSEAEYCASKNNCIHSALSLLGLEKFSSELLWTNTSTRFLLFKSIPGHGVIFEEVSESELQPGDILLFPLDRRNDIVSRALFKHAAVYCGDGEVIHFVGTGTAGPSSSRTIPGLIIKSGYQTLIKERGQCRIYRKKGGVNLNDFRSRVRSAMRSEANYNAYTNNCIHFALFLLDLLKFYSELREYTSIKFLWSKSLPGHEDIFEEVSESELQPGDILLFPESNANFISRALFKHAVVYCGDGEVIHFQSTGRGHIGLISKQGFEALKKERGECHIYRKKGGVDLNDLQSKVRTAMDSEAEYSLRTNNCIHFALSLLGLEKFYSELLVAGSVVMAFEEVCPERIGLIHKNYRKLCNLLIDL